MRLPAFFVTVMMLPALALAADSAKRDGKYVILQKKDFGAFKPKTPRPDYPFAFRKLGYEAAMRLRIYIGTDGKIDDVKIQKFYGVRDVGDYAVKKARETFTFSPPVLNGKPTPVCFDIPIVFVLNGRPGPVSSLWLQGETSDAFIDRVAR